MNYYQISPFTSEVEIKHLSDYNEDKMKQFAEIDRQKEMRYSVIVDNLEWDPPDETYSKRYNYHNYIEGRNFFHTDIGFKAYPPGVYLSEDTRFLSSVTKQYDENSYLVYKKLKEADLEQYLDFLENRYENYPDDENFTKKDMMREYLIDYIKRFPDRKGIHLFSLAEGNDFLARGMYLFDILPTLFIKIIR